MSKKYSAIGLGGTFDHLHIGHQYFLEFAASLADKLIIGLVSDENVQKKEFPLSIQTYEQRTLELEKFLFEEHISAEIFLLQDTFGPTILPNGPEAVAVTEATQQGGILINRKRQELQLKPLPVHVCELLKDTNGQYISSTRIRKGEIDREGNISGSFISETLQLNESQREFFSQKQGSLINHPQVISTPIFVVGDIALDTFLKNSWPFTLGFFDRKSLREAYVSPYLPTSSKRAVKSAPGVISPEVIRLLKKELITLEKKHLEFLEIEGEEDLITVILGLIAPLNSVIYYGQPNEGIVEVVVTEKLKGKFIYALKS